MDREKAEVALSALANRTRLAVFALLARCGPDGMTVTGIAEAVDIYGNLVSAHLAVLSAAGLVEQRRAGRNQIYRAVPSQAAELSGFLARLATGAVD